MNVTLDPFSSISGEVGYFASPGVVANLKATLQASRERSTLIRYSLSAQQFLQWRKNKEKPPKSVEILAFLAEKFYTSQSASAVQAASSALKWCFKFDPGPNPAESIWITSFLEGVRRSSPATVHHQKISMPEMRRVTEWKTEAIKDRRMVAYVSILFAGCMRPSEALRLKRSQVQFSETGMKLSISKDKTNKEGSERSVFVQRSPVMPCAVQILHDWISSSPKSEFVFMSFSKPSSPMSYDSARREWKRLAAVMGIKVGLTLHGFRGGAATAAIANGAPIDEVMRQGRWARQETLSAYVEVSPATVPVASSLFSRLRRTEHLDQGSLSDKLGSGISS